MDLEMYIHQWYKGVKIQKDSNIADMVAERLKAGGKNEWFIYWSEIAGY